MDDTSMKRMFYPIVRGEMIGDVHYATITTNDLDRQGEIIDPDGMDIVNFMANGVVLYGHQYSGMESIPVGKVASLALVHENEQKKWNMGWVFQGDDVTPLITAVTKSWDRGFLNTVSIGFLAKEYDGNIITKSELLEVSIVPVPANPQALRLNGFTDAEVKALEGEGKEGIETKSVIPYKETGKAPESEAWDAGAEVGAASVEDLKIMCAWYDEQKPDVKSSYKLPHHKASGHGVVWRAVAAAMAALLGGRGGVNVPDADKQGIYNHLAKHYAQFNKEPPAFHKAEPAPVDLIADLESMVTTKEGRVLSQKNRDLVKSCIDSLQALYEASDTSAAGAAQPESDDWLTALHKALIT